MTGTIICDTGRLVSLDGTINAISHESPVAIAFNRWFNAEFESLEHQFASRWEIAQLSQNNLFIKPEILNSWISTKQPCTTMEQAKEMANNFISSTAKPFLRLEICLALLQIPKDVKPK